MKIKLKNIIIAIIILILILLGLSYKYYYDKTSPGIIHFKPVGKFVAADKSINVFAAAGRIYIIQDSRLEESVGIINYLQLPIDSSGNVPYTLESLAFDTRKYLLYGGITVSNSGRPSIATRDLVLGGYTALIYSESNVLESTIHYTDNQLSVMQIYNGSYDTHNFYIQVDYDNQNGGTLCKFSFGGGATVCYPHLFPPLYSGDFFVTDKMLVYSDSNQVNSHGLMDNSSHQIGEKFDDIGRGIDPASGLLGYYEGNIYIAARLIKSDNTFMALCSLPLDANSSSNWKCSYDPDIPIGNTANITSFKIGLATGYIVVAISNYDSNTAQLFRLNIEELQNKKK